MILVVVVLSPGDRLWFQTTPFLILVLLSPLKLEISSFWNGLGGLLQGTGNCSPLEHSP